MLSKKLMAAIFALSIICAGFISLGCTSPATSPAVSPAASITALTGTLKVTGSTSIQPYADELARAFEAKYKGTKVLVSGGGSSVGVKSATDGTADIGTSSRDLTVNETSAGIEGIVIAYDGIVIIVHKNNPVQGLTTKQIRDIFSGNITNWKDVGGNDAPIAVVTRDSASGTRKAFEELVMGKGVNITSTAYQTSATGSEIGYISGNPNAIGYISYGSLDGSVKAIKVDGVAASVSTIKDNTYKIQRPFLYVVKKGEVSPLAQAFIDFTLSAEGQELLESGNLVRA